MPGCWSFSAGSTGNNVFQRLLFSATTRGERYVSRRQETRLQDGYAARIGHGGGGACYIRCFGGPAQGRQSERTDGAGYPAVAIDTRCRNQTVGTRRAGDNRCAAEQHSARARASGCGGAESRRYASAAAGSGRKDRRPDPAKVDTGRAIPIQEASNLILRSAPCARLEGWPRVHAPCPSFETLASQAPQDEVSVTWR
jgi:hypothetical protein